jgi:hypothetical protein
MKIKTLLLLTLFSAFASKGNCQTENLFIKSLGGLNGMTESVQKLWNSFFSLDSTINKGKIKAMTINLHDDIVPIVNAKRSIINKITNQPIENINIKNEIEKLEKSVGDLQATLLKYKGLIQAVGMDAEKLSSNLTMEFSAKLDNLDNLKSLLPDNYQRREFFITYLESGVNILNGTLLMLEKFK